MWENSLSGWMKDKEGFELAHPANHLLQNVLSKRWYRTITNNLFTESHHSTHAASLGLYLHSTSAPQPTTTAPNIRPTARWKILLGINLISIFICVYYMYGLTTYHYCYTPFYCVSLCFTKRKRPISWTLAMLHIAYQYNFCNARSVYLQIQVTVCSDSSGWCLLHNTCIGTTHIKFINIH